jgi:hypothetical protein
LILKPYENDDIKDKIHKLEIYLLDSEEVGSNNSFNQQEILEKQEKLEQEEILEEKFNKEIEILEKDKN